MLYRFIIIAITFLFSVRSNGQRLHTQFYGEGSFTSTVKDITSRNNPWGIGAGTLMVIDTRKAFRPIATLSGALYLEDDKVLLVFDDGSTVDRVSSFINLQLGGELTIGKTAFVRMTAGPCLVNHINFALQPSVGGYFTKKRNAYLNVFYLNVFNRYKQSQQDFRSVGFAMGFRI